MVAAPTEESVTTGEAAALFDWVRIGNTLVVFLAGPSRLGGLGPGGPGGGGAAYYTALTTQTIERQLAGFGISLGRPVAGGAAGSEYMTADAGLESPLNASAGAIAVDGFSRPLVEITPAAAVPLYVNGGKAYAVEAPVGQGRVVVVSSAAPTENASIMEADNLAFAMALAREGDAAGGIWFDEYHHGYKALFGARDVMSMRGFAAAALLAAAVALLFVISKGRRFGPVRPGVRYSRRHALEFVHSVAGLYDRARNRSHAASVLFRALSRRLARSAGAVTARTEAGQLVYRGELGPEMADLSRRCRLPVGSDGELVALVRAMDDLENRATGRRNA